MTAVPFSDLHAQYLSLKKEIDAAIADVIRTSAFIRGPQVESFEREFATAVDARHCVSCANGTDSLYIAMRALGVRPGDEVIVPAHSWISTSETVTQAGGAVVFCDTDSATYTIDPDALESLVTARTVGIIPVHLYGQPADMPAVMKVAVKHRLWVIEDCAQAHLARCDGRFAGSFGNAASWSFYPGKNLGAMGDAGAITTDDEALAQHMTRLARHGGLVKGEHRIEGMNSRLDGIQAAVLRVKLRHLDAWTRRRRAIAGRFIGAMSGRPGLRVPNVLPTREHVFHLFVVEHPERDALAAYLRRSGIESAVNYPVALPFLPAYERFAHAPAEFPNAFAAQSRILSLPIFAELSEAQIHSVIHSVTAFAAGER